MKLWKKIALICVSALLITAAVCCAVLLVYAKNTILGLARSQGTEKQKNLVSAFSSMAGYYVDDTTGAAAERAVVKYCFLQYADETSVLMQGGQTLCTQLSIDPAQYHKAINGYNGGEAADPYFLGKINGQDVLIYGNEVHVHSKTYLIYTVEDVTDIYGSISKMAWIFALAAIVCAMCGAFFATLLVRRTMKPLSRLSQSAKSIAGGDYKMRTQISSGDEVGELAADFNSMAAAIEGRIAELTETAERQRLFITGLTHEFKTPMTSILIHSDTVLNAKMSEAERERSLTHIYEQIRWLERLTQKLLKLVNLNEEIATERVSAAEMLESVRESVCDKLDSLGVRLVTAADDSLLDIDRDLMQSALVNLVDNAAKASAPGQTVYLTCRGGALTVADSGRGIAQGELARVTEPFYMADRSRSKKQGGSGLGLALVKRIAEAHRAQLYIESREGGGTTVTITFR